MDNISRGRFLKMSVVLGVAAVAGGVPYLGLRRRDSSYFLITDRPTGDLEKLIHITRIADDKRVSIEYANIRPSLSDLSVIENGRPIDPLRAGGLDPALRDFVYELRSRKRAGKHLIKIESSRLGENDMVVFSVNGEVVERVGLRNDYRRIVIVGDQGSTSFGLQNGYLSVTQASCRHEICKKMGQVSFGRIICAPNKLVATINPTYRLIDGITG